MYIIQLLMCCKLKRYLLWYLLQVYQQPFYFQFFLPSAAMHMAASIFTSPLGGQLSNSIGRRKTFLVLVTTGIVGFMTMALSPNIPVLFIGRFLTVVCCSLGPTISVQIAETVHADMRGSFVVFHSLFISLGMLIVLSFGYLVSDWRTLAWICIVPGIIQLPIVLFFLHDTPYWLIEKNR